MAHLIYTPDIPPRLPKDLEEMPGPYIFATNQHLCVSIYKETLFMPRHQNLYIRTSGCLIRLFSDVRRVIYHEPRVTGQIHSYSSSFIYILTLRLYSYPSSISTSRTSSHPVSYLLKTSRLSTKQ